MQTLNDCGCCEGLSVETPVPVYNRPGLKAITYRAGDHAHFKESLLARLSTSGLGALQGFTTRDNNDFTIALLDAWATVSDVLTFYQERIANESYLGTATESLSLVELSRLIGYELRPGVAAGAYLAFTIDENAGATGGFTSPGTPHSKPETVVHIEPGTKVQSVPGQDEQPQTFETLEPIEARAEWNAIRPRLKQPQTRIEDNTIVVIEGTNNDLKAGDIVLIRESLKLKKILKIVIEEETKTTCLYFDPNPKLPLFQTPMLEPVYPLPPSSVKLTLNEDVVNATIIGNKWKAEDLYAFITVQKWTEADVKEGISKVLAAQAATKDKLDVFRKRAAVFGYNAPKQMLNATGQPLHPAAWTEWPLTNETNDKIYLDTVYDQVLPGSYIAVQKSTDSLDKAKVYPAQEVEHRSRTDYGIGMKTTVVTTNSNEAWWETDAKLCRENYPCLALIRGITVHAQTAPLILTESLIKEPVEKNTIVLDRLYLGLKRGQTVILSGERADLKGVSFSELRVLDTVLVIDGITVIVFDKPLTYSYIRSSVVINANIARATHGETVSETLGSGDAAKPFQKFVLKQPPLTFISAATPTGGQSTLQIRVNDLLWHEVPSLYDHGPGEHIYTTRQDDQGKTTVTFGDGRNGARLPTGQENIKATYRKGIGGGGLVKQDQLSQLLSRPLGVKGVTNPFPATGAEDPEQLEDIRSNATLPIFTLDRIVSLQDYEDFARSFSGISKALATWTWTGQKRSVYVTIAGKNGAAVAPADLLYQNLLTAISGAGIPEVPVAVASYQPRFFRVVAKIQVHPDHIPEQVIATAEKHLRTSFSFSGRAFGQPIALSEVIAVMQQVEGVTAVDVDAFHRADEAVARKDRIDAEMPRPSRESPSPAELLTLDPGPVDLKQMV
jgi:predicted phage baseplate assembly protein